MQLSSSIPPTRKPSQHLEAQHDLEDQELEEIFGNQTINALMAETNAGGFGLSRCEYDRKTDTFSLQLKGNTPEGRTFCGDTIQLIAKRDQGKIKLLQAEVDRSYMCDDIGMDL